MELLDRSIGVRAAERPDAIALVWRDERISYGELEASSNRIARALKRAGARRGDRVCLLLPKSPRAIMAIVGVLKAGGVYVPLDPDSPSPRLKSMIASCDTRWILAARSTAPAVHQIFDAPDVARNHVVGWLDDTAEAEIPTAFRWPDIASEESQSTSMDQPLDSPAYLLFTSGSTGAPKGVVITHANVAAFLAWALPYFGFASDDRISGHPPLQFDLSVFDIFGALTIGAQLHLVPPELNLLPAQIVRLIEQNSLTQWFSVPAVMNLIAKFDLLSQTNLASLRRVLWCGEVLPTSVLRYWMRQVPQARFTNLYGPTEAAIASSFYTVPACPSSDAEQVPIGIACEGEELLVLDEGMHPAPQDTIGDLYIGGTGLSPGYWRDPDKTARAFVADPRLDHAGERLYRTGDLARVANDGQTYFVGRADTQIKSRGYRIELGEIEAALTAESLLKEGAVVAVKTNGFDGVAICCAYVPLGTTSVSPADLRRRLASRLPAYMLPSRWKAFDNLPRNSNGKVDRHRIEAEFNGGAS